MNSSGSQPLCIEPAFDRPDAAVVFAADARYALYAAVTISSVIAATSPDKRYDLVLLETEVPEEDLRLMASMAEGRDNVSLRFFNVAEIIADREDSFFVNAHLSRAAYYRLFAPSIFKNYEKIIYLDVDLIALADVADLYAVELEEALVGAVRDYYAVKDLLAKPDDPWTRQVNMKSPADYFNSGVLLMNLARMRAENFEDTWHQYLQRVKTPRLHDQDTLNSCCEGRVKYLDAAWNCQKWNEYLLERFIPGDLPDEVLGEYERSREHPFILHYLSSNKPWNWPQLELAGLFWDQARRTPFYDRLLFENLKRLSAENMALKYRQKFPPVKLRRAFYKLMSSFGSPGSRNKYRNKIAKIDAVLR